MMKVLVVDDNLIELEIVKNALNDERFECETISNPLEAWVKINEFKPDLVILDLNMPEMNGFELCKQIKTNPTTQHIGVIILTAEEAESDNLLRGIHLGVLDYIHKPISSKELVQALEAQDAAMNVRRSFEKLYQVTSEISDKLSQPKPTLQLFFGAGKSWRSRLIRLITWSRWSHVAIVDGGDVIEAAGGQGVRRTPMGLLKAKYGEDWEIREIDGDIEKAREMIGREYDTSGLAGWFFRQLWEDPERWFCSELVAYASDLYPDDTAYKITPEDLYRVSREIAPVN